MFLKVMRIAVDNERQQGCLCYSRVLLMHWQLAPEISHTLSMLSLNAGCQIFLEKDKLVAEDDTERQTVDVRVEHSDLSLQHVGLAFVNDILCSRCLQPQHTTEKAADNPSRCLRAFAKPETKWGACFTHAVSAEMQRTGKKV